MMLGEMAFCRQLVNRPQLGSDDAQLLIFKAADDLVNEAARNAVGLHNKKRSINDEAI
jgi:hypothetical protein